MKRFCFRFDVDTHRCMRRGVPALMRLARELDIFSHVDVPRESHVLDVGCGVGLALRAMTTGFATYMGIDISKPFIELARESYGRRPNVQFSCGVLGDFGADCFVKDTKTVFWSFGPLAN